ncbi:hypothetical protein [Bradyrhizobium sp. BWC-3-1]|uniref:hypothetical protein n=1 Tax=Bradyrhizobium sp. BWC-3-1 TaxID=3080012 RepID=UPI00293E4BCF|nr:hypothetical protein [Bradyrhizobium sp. BWC-3-1]WOH59945.1 hypothetical protein RX329_07460 [Bradyrhizobium sp. BWC-3-1]
MNDPVGVWVRRSVPFEMPLPMWNHASATKIAIRCMLRTNIFSEATAIRAMAMNEVAMLNAELDRCKAELRDLNAKMSSISCTQPVDMTAVEDVARRIRQIAERVEVLTRTILHGPQAGTQ